MEPGYVHRKLATMTLKMLTDKSPVPLSVGELPLPSVAEVDGNGSVIEDGREPVELLARIFAHIGHRVPGLRKVEKRFEGTEARSGIGSDFFALLGQLYSRNEAVITNVAEGMIRESLSNAKTQRKATTEPDRSGPIPTPHWGEQEAAQ